MNVIVLIGVRGDSGFLSRQMNAQMPNWSNCSNKRNERRKLVMVGPSFGSMPVACTPKEHPKELPDTEVLHFIIDAIRNPSIDFYMVPAAIDKCVLRNFREYSKFLSGSSRQKSSFARTLNAHAKEIQSVMHSSLKSPVTVTKAKDTEECCTLLKNVPGEFWPTAYEINGTVVQPLGASCYFGSGGNELQGMLATTLLKSLRECRTEPQKFGDTYIDESSNMLSEYQHEIARLQNTCYVYDGATQKLKNDVSLTPRHNLNWPRMKFVFYSRYGSDISRKIGPLKKSRLYSLLDQIMQKQEKIGSNARRKSIKEKNLSSNTKTEKNDENLGNIAATSRL